MVELSNGRSVSPPSLSQLSETLYFSSRSCCPPKVVIGLPSQLHPLSFLSGWSNRVQLRHRWGIVGVLTNMPPPTNNPSSPHTDINTYTQTETPCISMWKGGPGFQEISIRPLSTEGTQWNNIKKTTHTYTMIPCTTSKYVSPSISIVLDNSPFLCRHYNKLESTVSTTHRAINKAQIGFLKSGKAKFQCPGLCK